MKVLIIHPKDKTTDFLIKSYNSDFTIIRTELSDTLLKKLIRSHDVIIMMGHGTEEGLIGFGRTYIGSDFVDELRKKFCICIWCYASDFAKKYKLKTMFSTGMFISEMEEAYLMGLKEIDQNMINCSNYWFSEALSFFFLNLDSQKLTDVHQEYMHEDQNPIMSYNVELFYSNQ